MIRAAYFDYFENDIEKQISLYEKTNKDISFILRNVNGDSFFNLETKQIKEIIAKLHIKILDLGNYIISFLKDDPYKLINIVKATDIKYLVIRLEDKKDMENIIYLRKIIALLPDINFIIKFPSGKKSEQIKTFLEAFDKNKVLLYFSPVDIYLSRQSYTLEYRLLKKRIGLVALSDINNFNDPTLLGYGAIDLIDFFKRLYDNGYSNIISLDTNLYNIMENFDESQKKFGSFKKRSKYKTNIQFFIDKVKPGAIEIDMDDLFFNQLNVLNEIFKIN